jgi:hypothetical protein
MGDENHPPTTLVANSGRHWVTSIMMHRHNYIGENSARRGAYVCPLKRDIQGLATI